VIWVAALAVIAFLVIGFATGFFAITPTTDSTPVAKSSFVVTSNIDGEFVSDLVPISIWTPKLDAVFATTEDLYDMLKYTESIVNTVAALATIDLSEYAQVWVETQPTATPASPFANDYRLIFPNGVNKVYQIQGKDQVTDVNGVVVDADLAAITVAAYATNGNFTILYDCPHYTTTATELHYGTNWALSAADFALLNEVNQQKYWNEKYWAGEFGVFVPDDFAYKAQLSHPNLAGMTDAFAFEITFNASVSIVDGETNQINFTLTDNVMFDAHYNIVGGVSIYLVSYSPINFLNGVNQLRFEMTFGTYIELATIKSVRVPIEQSGNKIGTAVALSTF